MILLLGGGQYSSLEAESKSSADSFNQDSLVSSQHDKILQSYQYSFNQDSNQPNQLQLNQPKDSNHSFNYFSSPKLSLFSTTTQGKGAVIADAFALLDSDIYVMIDGDTQCDTSILPHAIAQLHSNQLDMLNIARSKSDSAHYRIGHGFGNKLLSTAAAIFFGKKFGDMLSGYRIFSRAFVKSFPAQSKGFEIETELSVFALQQNLRVDEIEASYKPRPQGSFSKLHTFKDGFKILFMIFQLLFTERPLLVFGFLSALCFVISLIVGVDIYLEFLDTSRVARYPTLFVCVGVGVIGVVLGVAGMLAHLVVRGNRESRRMAYLNHKKID